MNRTMSPRVRRYAYAALVINTTYTAESLSRIAEYVGQHFEKGLAELSGEMVRILTHYHQYTPTGKPYQRVPRPADTDATLIHPVARREILDAVQRIGAAAYDRQDVNAIAAGKYALCAVTVKYDVNVYDYHGRFLVKAATPAIAEELRRYFRDALPHPDVELAVAAQRLALGLDPLPAGANRPAPDFL